ISFSTMRPRLGDMHDNWGWTVFYNYILLEKEADVQGLQAKLHDFKVKYVGAEDKNRYQTHFWLQPITDIHLKSQLQDEQSPVGDERTVYFLSILAVFILAVAWINYINLSTAKALERSKEVGLRKTVGASRGQLISQFLFDTVCINFLAVALAALIVFASWSTFEALVGKQLNNVIYFGGITPWLLAAII